MRHLLALFGAVLNVGCILATPLTPDSSDTAWKRSLRQVAEEQQGKIKPQEKYLISLDEKLQKQEAGSLLAIQAKFIGTNRLLTKDHLNLLRIYARCWDGILAVLDKPLSQKETAARLLELSCELLQKEAPALKEIEKNLTVMAQLAAEGSLPVEPSRAAVESFRAVHREVRGCSVGMLAAMGQLHRVLGDLEIAWCILKRDLVLVRAVYEEYDPRINDARIALADVDRLIRSPAGEESRFPEWERLGREVEGHLTKEDYRAAATALKARLAIVPELMGPVDEIQVAGNAILGEYYSRIKDYGEAAKAFRASLQAAGALHPTTHKSVTFARLALADAQRLARGGENLRPRLPELKELSDQVQRADEEGRPADAVQVLRKKVDLFRDAFGADDMLVAVTLETVAAVNYKLKHYAEVATDLQKALRIQQTVRPKTDPVLIEARIMLADAERLRKPDADGIPQVPRLTQLQSHAFGLLAERQLGRSVGPLEEFVQTLRRLLGEDDPFVVDSTTKLAEVYELLGQHADEIRILKEALKGAVGCYGPSDWRTTDIRRKRAAAEREMRKDPVAESLREQVAPLIDKLKQQFRRSDYQGALETSRQVAELYRSAGDEEKRVAYIHSQITCYMALGDASRAEASLRDLLMIQEQLLKGKEHPEYAASLKSLGSLHFSMRQPKTGLVYLQQAFDIRKRNRPADNTIQEVVSLAMRYRDNGRVEEALKLIPEAANLAKNMVLTGLDTPSRLSGAGPLMLPVILPVKVRGYAEAMITLGKALNALGGHAEAERLAVLVLTIAREYGEQVNPYLEAAEGRSSTGLGDGNWPALAEFEVARNYSLALDVLASAQTGQGEFAAAAATHRRDAQITKKLVGEQTEAYASALRDQAKAGERLGDHEQAAALLKQAAAIIRQNMDWSFAGSNLNQQLLLTSLYREYLDDYLSAGLRARLPAEELYREILPWKGAVFAARRWVARAKGDPTLSPMVDEWQKVIQELITAASGPSPVAPTGTEPSARLRDLRGQMDRLETELANRSAEFRRGLEQAKYSPADVLAAMPPDAALIDFLVFSTSASPKEPGKETREHHLLAFVLRPARPITVADLGPVTDVERAISGWRIAIGADPLPPGTLPGKEADWAGELRRIFSESLREVRGYSTLLVSPDGALAGFPIGLLAGEQKSYLLEEKQVALVPVPRLLPEARQPRAVGRRAGPVRSLLVTTGEAAKPPLTGAVDLLNEVETLMVPQPPLAGAVKRLVESDAHRAAFRAAAPGKDQLFILAHGFYDPLRALGVNRLPQGTAKSAADTGGNDTSKFPPDLAAGLELFDGPFTALEVSQLDLSAADLVILPVCKSSLGLSISGEGLLGLQRAFHVAGARTVVSTLWSVSDDVTRDAMRQFLNKFRTGATVSAALQAAQIDIKDNGVGLRFRPYYWAGLVLSGSPDLLFRAEAQGGK